MADFAIVCRELSKRYGRVWALAQVTFDLPAGRVLLVAGHNGSGKTTLFRTLATAVRADGGTARVAGVDITDRYEVRKRTSLLTHHAYAYDSLTAADNLRSFARLGGWPIFRVQEVLEEVGLAGRQREPISQFSAGMRKRLAIARVLLQLSGGGGQVVFLDEPYAALDPQGLIMIDQLIERLRDENRTVVIASHLLERSASLSTDAIVLQGGRLIWSGPAGEVLSRGQLRGVTAEVTV